jgi:hypothetical protein
MLKFHCLFCTRHCRCFYSQDQICHAKVETIKDFANHKKLISPDKCYTLMCHLPLARRSSLTTLVAVFGRFGIGSGVEEERTLEQG